MLSARADPFDVRDRQSLRVSPSSQPWIGRAVILDGIDERWRERPVVKEEWNWRKICVDCRVFRPCPGYNFVDNPSITNSRGCTALCSRLGSFCRFVWGAATSRKSQSPNRKSICAAVRVLLVATTLHVAACYTWLPWLAIVASRVYNSLASLFPFAWLLHMPVISWKLSGLL